MIDEAAVQEKIASLLAAKGPSGPPAAAKARKLVPAFQVIEEKPEHSAIVILRSQNLTAKDIFRELGGLLDTNGEPIPGSGHYNLGYIEALVNQDWFKAKLLKIYEARGKSKLQAVLELEELENIQCLIKLRDNAPHSTAFKAATYLLEMLRGKVPEREGKPPSAALDNVPTDAAALDRELEALQNETTRF